MTKYILTIVVFFTIISFAKSQAVVLEEDVNVDTLESKKGPNLKNFAHLYFEFGFNVFPQETGAEINPVKSNILKLGYKYKYKICNFYALGFDIHYLNSSFNLAQNTSKLLPDSIMHDNENIIINNLGFEFYNRFNFGRRGNMIGKYMDIGAFGTFIFNKKHQSVDKSNDPNIAMGHKQEIVNTGLIYVQSYSYGVNARVGINRYALTASYRLSDIFKTESESFTFNYPELPRLYIGLQIGLF
ncbi:MAG TPA: hypothetical protein DDX39_06080 [Bacteroidales bacterium]|nr:MAG: hypothetical protein A2W98_07345 [Bacteroidetes bacterium GWF2_33_38]OFY74173.1 MAG: hypothetical protein A2265_04830 [Bacteroidetes bacterium RIFOXYA12_FULL_33_9]OFY87809.1 MAG: hypothetical protein A2236_01350 [Bacteroidetes bacterium RIFOXYA2_FULL_33_7]HBF88194.1 hypothetical protein [Bacteroidales bacterium]